MLQTLAKSWWLLALGGVLNAAYALLNFLGMHANVHRGNLLQMGLLALAAGACTIAASLTSSQRGKSWPLALNGLACSALGLIFTFWTGKLAFRTVALLIIVMAISIGIYELATARSSMRQFANAWLLTLVGIASIGFAGAFLALTFGWIKLQPGSPGRSLFWLGAYFLCSAIGMLGLALRSPVSSLPASRP